MQNGVGYNKSLANEVIEFSLTGIINNYREKWQYNLAVECIDKYLLSERMNVMPDDCFKVPDVPNINFLTSYLSFISSADMEIDFNELRDIVMTYHFNTSEGTESRDVAGIGLYVTNDVVLKLRNIIVKKAAGR